MKYRNEDDKCYGVTGMVLGLSVFDANDLFTSVSIDGEDNSCISFTPDFYFSGNPRLSAKDSWQCLYSHYQISMGLVISNVLCRKMLLDRGVLDGKTRKALLDVLSDEGKETCQLERDEVEQVFDKTYSYLMRIFSNSGLAKAIRQFAERLKEKRTLSNGEALDLLDELNIKFG